MNFLAKLLFTFTTQDEKLYEQRPTILENGIEAAVVSLTQIVITKNDTIFANAKEVLEDLNKYLLQQHANIKAYKEKQKKELNSGDEQNV